MAKLTSIRGAQRLMEATFLLNVANGDTLQPTVGNTLTGIAPDPYNKDPNQLSTPQTVGNFYAGVAQYYDIICMPPGAVIVGGEVFVQTAFVGPTAATISVGDMGDSVNGAASGTRYANAVNLLATGRTALTLPGIVMQGQNLRATITQTVANATAGIVYVRALWITEGRQDEMIGY